MAEDLETKLSSSIAPRRWCVLKWMTYFFCFFSGGSEDWGCYGCGMSFVATRYTTVKLNVAGCAIGLGSPSVSVGDGFW